MGCNSLSVRKPIPDEDISVIVPSKVLGFVSRSTVTLAGCSNGNRRSRRWLSPARRSATAVRKCPVLKNRIDYRARSFAAADPHQHSFALLIGPLRLQAKHSPIDRAHRAGVD